MAKNILPVKAILAADSKYPAYGVRLNTPADIDATSTGQTNLYTVPSGKIAVITGAVVRLTAIDTLTTVPDISIGATAAEYEDIVAEVTLTNLDTVGEYIILGIASPAKSVAATGVIKIDIDTGATATGYTIQVDLFGYLVDA